MSPRAPHPSPRKTGETDCFAYVVRLVVSCVLLRVVRYCFSVRVLVSVLVCSCVCLSAERVPGERAVRGGLVSHDSGVLLGVPQAWCHRPAEAASLHHESQQVQVTQQQPKCC